MKPLADGKREEAMRRLQSPTVVLENALAEQGVTHTGLVAEIVLALSEDAQLEAATARRRSEP